MTIINHIFTRDGVAVIPLSDMEKVEGEDDVAVVVHQTKVIVDQTLDENNKLHHRITFIHYI